MVAEFFVKLLLIIAMVFPFALYWYSEISEEKLVRDIMKDIKRASREK